MKTQGSMPIFEPACAQQDEEEEHCSVLEEVLRRAQRQKQHFVSATDPALNGQLGSERRTEWTNAAAQATQEPMRTGDRGHVVCFPCHKESIAPSPEYMALPLKIVTRFRAMPAEGLVVGCVLQFHVY